MISPQVSLFEKQSVNKNRIHQNYFPIDTFMYEKKTLHRQPQLPSPSNVTLRGVANNVKMNLKEI